MKVSWNVNCQAVTQLLTLIHILNVKTQKMGKYVKVKAINSTPHHYSNSI